MDNHYFTRAEAIEALNRLVQYLLRTNADPGYLGDCGTIDVYLHQLGDEEY